MGVIEQKNGYVYTMYIHMTDRELLIEAFELLYTIYRNQHGTRYSRHISVYPTLSKIQKQLDKPIRQESLSIVRQRQEANSPWT